MGSYEQPASSRSCRVCDEPLRGRSDKQYCSDYCRAIQYNRIHAGDIQLLRHTHYILRVNRNILRRLHVQEGKRSLSRDVLLVAGFRPEFMTRLVQRRGDRYAYYCYDYGYEADSRGRIRILAPSADQPLL